MAVTEELITRLEAIPEELRRLKQWVAWRLEEREGKGVTKVPVSAATGRHASSTDPATWCSFPEAVVALRTLTGIAGVGFVFTADDPYCGLDWDKCRVDGVVERVAADQMRALQSYSEVSWSSTGGHVIVKAALPPGGRRRGQIEMYDRGRFFAVTGEQFPWSTGTVEHRQAEIETLHQQVFGGTKRALKGHQIDHQIGTLVLDPATAPPLEKFAALLENDRKFRWSWERKRKDFQDQSPSVYDMSLAVIASMAGWSDSEILALLMAARRHFGDPIKHDGYYRLTLERARSGAAEVDLATDATKKEAEIDLQMHDEVAPPPEDLLAGVSTRLALKGPNAIQKVIKVDGDPPEFMVYLQSGKSVELGGIDGLIGQRFFASAIAGASGVIVPPLGKGVWAGLAQAMLNAAEVWDIGNEGHPALQLAALIDRYLEKNQPIDGDWKAAAMACVPFVMEGRVWVSIRSLIRFWLQNQSERLSERRMSRHLRMLGWVDREVAFRVEVGGIIHRRVWGQERALPSPDDGEGK